MVINRNMILLDVIVASLLLLFFFSKKVLFLVPILLLVGILFSILIYVNIENNKLQDLLISGAFIVLPFTSVQSMVYKFVTIGVIDIYFPLITIYVFLVYFKYPKIKSPLIFKSIYIFIVFYILTGLVKFDTFFISFRFLVYMVYGFSFYKLILFSSINKEKIIRIIDISLKISLVLIAVAFIELIMHFDITPLLKIRNVGIDNRVSSLMDINGFGIYLSFLIIFATINFEISKKKSYLVFIALFLFMILLSKSRSALLVIASFVVGYIMIKIVFAEGKKRLVYGIYAILAVISFVIMIIYIYINRLSGQTSLNVDLSLIARLFLWKAAYIIGTNNFWFGIGFGGFGYSFTAYIPSFVLDFISMRNLPNAHNFSFHIFAESGIIGLIVSHLLGLALIVYEIIVIKRQKNTDSKIIISIFIVALISIFIGHEFDSFVFNSAQGKIMMFFFFLYAMLMYFNRIETPKFNDKQDLID